MPLSAQKYNLKRILFVGGVTAFTGQCIVEISNRKYIEGEQDERRQRSLAGFETRMLWLHGIWFTVQGALDAPARKNLK